MTEQHSESTTQAGIEQLEVRLQGQLSGRVRNFRLAVAEFGVVLHGFARTYYAKQLAQHAFMRETQLPIAANEIKVF